MFKIIGYMMQLFEYPIIITNPKVKLVLRQSWVEYSASLYIFLQSLNSCFVPVFILVPPDLHQPELCWCSPKRNLTFQDTNQEGEKADEVEKAKSCQLEFGSYCLWSIEHKEIMKDYIVKRLKDQLFVARSYYPSIAKIQGQEALTQEMKQNIQDHERILSVSSVDADLPSL